MYTIYRLYCSATNRDIYVGCTNRPLRIRFREFFIDSKIDHPVGHHSEKYGRDCLSIHPLFIVEDKENAYKIEAFYVQSLKTHVSHGGCNKTLTGQHGTLNLGKFGKDHPQFGRHHTEESKEKMRKKLRHSAWEHYDEIIELSKTMSQRDIGAIFGCDKNVIRGIQRHHRAKTA